MKLSSLYITVQDMDRAIQFYSKFLQIKPTIHEARFSSFNLNGFGFDLFAPAEDGEERILGNSTIPVFETDDLNFERKRVLGLGCELVLEQQINGYNLFQFKDTEDNIIEVFTILKDN